MSNIIKIAALDGSKSNFGVAILDYNLDTGEIAPTELSLTTTEKSKEKQVRKSSDNLDRAVVITKVLPNLLKDCAAVFVEVPSGGKSYDAVLGFGTVIGIYAGIAGMLGLNLIEVSPSETKKAAVGTRTASKEEMIDWAVNKYPTAPWLRARGKSTGALIAANEHLADAVAIAHAGVRTPMFQQTLAILKSVRAASSPIAA